MNLRIKDLRLGLPSLPLTCVMQDMSPCLLRLRIIVIILLLDYRPIQLSTAQIQLAACRYVDEVVVYQTEQDLVDLLLILPLDVRILGEEYADKPFTGDQECYARGIQIVFNGRDHSFSSSSLRKRVAAAESMKALKG